MLESHGAQQCETNLYGVVMGFGAAMQTKRGDWMLNVTLVDETSIRGENGGNTEENKANMLTPIPLIIFCKTSHQLPILRRAGEILRLHRVVVQVNMIAAYDCCFSLVFGLNVLEPISLIGVFVFSGSLGVSRRAAIEGPTIDSVCGLSRECQRGAI